VAEVVAGVVVPVNVLVVGVDIVLVIGATSTAIAAENLTCLPMSSAAVAVVNRKPICEDGAHSHIWRGKRGKDAKAQEPHHRDSRDRPKRGAVSRAGLAGGIRRAAEGKGHERSAEAAPRNVAAWWSRSAAEGGRRESGLAHGQEGSAEEAVVANTHHRDGVLAGAEGVQSRSLAVFAPTPS
jgi:hypothetical protein